MISNTWPVDSMPAAESEQTEAVANQAFGFWIYLLSDLVLFSAIFSSFAVLSRSYAGGPTGKDLFDLTYVFAETMLLLSSSATFGLSMLAMPAGKQRLVLAGLVLTFLLGLGFISMEVSEFHRMILEGNGPQRSAFLSAFFTLVGTHGTHVVCGLVWIAVMLGQIRIKGLTTPVQSRLMRLGMFWHFLDLVWIGVFSVVYLMEVV